MRPANSSFSSLIFLSLLISLYVSVTSAASLEHDRFARASPLRWGKRAGDILRWGKREPLRWGKRSVDMQEEDDEEEAGLTRNVREAPLRWVTI